jgi:plastocyanin
MKHPFRHTMQATIAPGILLMSLLLASLVSFSSLYAAQGDIKVIEVKLGDYRFIPEEIQLIADQPAILRLVNTDSITPHNFTMKAANSAADINVDVLGGESIDVQLDPLPAGRYTFFCANKLIFMKSHREKGMQGTLIVVPE